MERLTSRCLPVDEWPELDRQLWRTAMAFGSLLDQLSVAQDWAAATRAKTQRGYGRWLSWLNEHGLLHEGRPPGARVERERVKAYANQLGQTCAPYTVFNRLHELADAMRVLQPDGDWRWLKKAGRTLTRSAPVRDKRARLRSPGELIAVGEQLMDRAEGASGWSDLRRAVHYRDGLMIALLASRPVRMRNLASMQLGEHLIEREGCYWMTFAGWETKSGAPYEAILPDNFTQQLQRYLGYYRPLLVLGESKRADLAPTALWVSEVGTQLDQGVMAVRIRKHTKATFGTAITPHLFRDAAATEIAISNPSFVDDARSLLGHASLHTTERHYIQARSLAASRAYCKILQISAREIDG